MVQLIRQQHALQFLPKPEDTAGQFGDIIGQALQGLAHQKIQSHQTKNKEKFLTEGGFHPEFARELAKQPDETIQKVLSGLEGFGTQQPQQGQNQGGLKPKGNLIAERNQIEKERNSLIKESHNYHKQVINKGKEAQRRLGILDKIEKLNDKGRLSGGTWSNINKLLGTSSVGTTPDTERLDKLSAQLLPQGLTQQQLLAEQRKIPNTGQSKKARSAIIKDLKQELQKEIDEEAVLRDIQKQNKGKFVPGLEQMVQERLGRGQQEQQQEQPQLQLAAQANTLQELNPQEGDVVEGPDGSLFQLVQGQFIPYQGR